MGEINRDARSIPSDQMTCLRYIIEGSVGNEVKYRYEYVAFKRNSDENWIVHKKNAITGEIVEVVLHKDFMDFLIAENARIALGK